VLAAVVFLVALVNSLRQWREWESVGALCALALVLLLPYLSRLEGTEVSTMTFDVDGGRIVCSGPAAIIPYERIVSIVVERASGGFSTVVVRTMLSRLGVKRTFTVVSSTDATAALALSGLAFRVTDVAPPVH